MARLAVALALVLAATSAVVAGPGSGELDLASERTWLDAAVAAEADDDLGAALAASRNAVAATPDSAEARHLLGRLLLRSGRGTAALDELAHCRRLDPTREPCHLLAALHLRDSERLEAAIELLEQGLEETASPLLAEQLGLLLLAADRAAEALAVAEAALVVAPRAGDLMLLRALAAAATGDEAPFDDFERALELGVAHPYRARLEWARAAADRDRWSLAVEQLEAAAQLQADDPELFFRLATARRQAGDAEGAAAALERYRELEAERADVERRRRELGTALNEAQRLANEGRIADAWARLDDLGEAAAGSPRVWSLRAKLLYADGRADDARRAAIEALRLAPVDAEAAYLVAAFSLAGGRHDDAVVAADLLVTLEPELGEGWALLGSSLARQVRLEEASAAFARALELGFDGRALRQEYAAVLSDLGRVEESRAQLDALRRLEGEGR